MSGDKNKMTDYLQVVSFNLNGEEYAIQISNVKEIILHEGVTTMPQMPDFIEGIINLRGNVISILDLRKRFGFPVAEKSEQTRIIISRMGTKTVGLIVDSVSQVMKLTKESIQPPPETIAGLTGDYLIGIANIEQGLIILLDIEKILSESESNSVK